MSVDFTQCVNNKSTFEEADGVQSNNSVSTSEIIQYQILPYNFDLCSLNPTWTYGKGNPLVSDCLYVEASPQDVSTIVNLDSSFIDNQPTAIVELSNTVPHQCSRCDVTFNNEYNLTIHLLLEHTILNQEQISEQTPLICPLCSKKFSRLAALKCHIKFHRVEENAHALSTGNDDEIIEVANTKQHRCRLCGTVNENPNQLRTHYRQCHPNVRKLLQPDLKLPKCLQATCGIPTTGRKSKTQAANRIKCFTSRLTKNNKTEHANVFPNHVDDFGNLNDYIQEVSTKKIRKNFMCVFCKKKFPSRGSAKRHLTTHTKQKCFSCPICFKKFTQKSSVKTHMAIHDETKSIKCQFCNRIFNYAHNLSVHMQQHHLNTQTKLHPKAHSCNYFPFEKLSLTLISKNLSILLRNKPNRKICYHCFRSFKCQSMLAVHAYQHFKRLQSHSVKRGQLNDSVLLRRINVKHDHSDLLKELLKTSSSNLGISSALIMSSKRRQWSRLFCKLYRWRHPFVNLLGNIPNTDDFKGPFICPECSQFVWNSASIKHHIVSHFVAASFICPYCLRKFHLFAVTIRHINIVHLKKNVFPFVEPKSQLVDALEQLLSIIVLDKTTKESITLPDKLPLGTASTSTAFQSNFPFEEGSNIVLTVAPDQAPQMVTIQSDELTQTCSVIPSVGDLFQGTMQHSETIWLDPNQLIAFEGEVPPYDSSTGSNFQNAIIGSSVLVPTSAAEFPKIIDASDIQESAPIALNSTVYGLQSGEVYLLSQPPTVSNFETYAPQEFCRETVNYIYEPDQGSYAPGIEGEQTLNLSLSEEMGLGCNQLVQPPLTASATVECDTLNTHVAPSQGELAASVAYFQPHTPVSSFSANGTDKQIPEFAGNMAFYGCLGCSAQFYTAADLVGHANAHSPTLHACSRCGTIDPALGSKGAFCQLCGLEGGLETALTGDNANEFRYFCSHCNTMFGSISILEAHVTSVVAFEKENANAVIAVVPDGIINVPTTTYPVPTAPPNIIDDDHSNPCMTSEAIMKVASHLQLSEKQIQHLIQSQPTTASSDSERFLIEAAHERHTVSYPKSLSLSGTGHVNKEFSSKATVICSLCSYRFRRSSDLRRHMYLHSGIRPYGCDFCPRRFILERRLLRHLTSCHGEAGRNRAQQFPPKRRASTKTIAEKPRSFSCHVCGKVCCTRDGLRGHVRIHTNTKKYACSFCNALFRTPMQRKRHILMCAPKHHQRLPSSTVDAAGSLEVTTDHHYPVAALASETVHLQAVDGVAVEQSADFEPVDSESRFELASYFINLGESQTTNTVLEQTVETRWNQTIDVDLDQTSAESSRLKELLTGSIQCRAPRRQMQSFSFDKQKSALKQQANACCDFVWQCKQCLESFPSEHLSKQHACVLGEQHHRLVPLLRTFHRLERKPLDLDADHEGQPTTSSRQVTPQTPPRALSCEACGRHFQRASELRRHERIRRHERPFACEICGSSFTQSGALHRHRELHEDPLGYTEGRSQFRCPVCSTIFRQKSNMLRHVSNVHKLADTPGLPHTNPS